jgi:predicted  nucleic acid-binding Zn-ribbon protein
VFDGLKARLERLLRERGPDPRAYAAGLREALVEARFGIAEMRRALAAAETELQSERKQLTDAERRGKLAAAVPDPETVAVAERFATRHRERIQVLERKVAVQRDELALAEREVQEMTAQWRSASRAGGASSASIDAAWRDLEAAGATRTDDSDRVAADLDRKRREEAVEAQLAYLKRKMGKDGGSR